MPKRKPRAGPLSLYPLSFDEAIKRLVQAKPPVKKSAAKKKKPKGA